MSKSHSDRTETLKLVVSKEVETEDGEMREIDLPPPKPIEEMDKRERRIFRTKTALLEAYQASLGNIAVACKSVGVTRPTFYNYYNQDPAFARAIDDTHEAALDFAEGQLMKLIGQANVPAVIFYLKTKGKERGYIEDQNVNARIEIAIKDSSE